MRIYRIRIIADKWPTDYNVEASNWATGIARAVREWTKEGGKGSRTKELSVRAVRSSSLLKEEK